MPQHELARYMAELKRSMAADYARIRDRVAEDPGTAGDESEESWAELFRNWLPAEYPVVTKGRIVNTWGEASGQWDVLLLNPSYPRYLRNRKHYFADGVVAAFECKLTLRKHHVQEVVRRAKSVKDLYPQREGTPYEELHKPLIVGLLAHSSDWSGRGELKFFELQAAIEESLSGTVEHPSDLMDVICVADAGTLYSAFSIKMGRSLDEEAAEFFNSWSPEGGVESFYFSITPYGPDGEDRGESSIGALIADVTTRMAWENSMLRRFANYFFVAGVQTPGIARPIGWPPTVFSGSVKDRLLKKTPPQDPWDFWARDF